MAEIPRSFDPQFNSQYEYLPYDEDPAIQSMITDENQAGRDLAQRVRAWQDAVYEIQHDQANPAAQNSLQYAEQNLEEYLRQQGINRSVREKPAP